MAVQSTARRTGSRTGIAVALHLLLRLLALLVFAQAVFAGLFLDGTPPGASGMRSTGCC